ncbi:MAG: hypothetical protein JW969_05450 [Spirochaetales bacterium]|nr:hypothetical protein [Spirochaetales bacterium]
MKKVKIIIIYTISGLLFLIFILLSVPTIISFFKKKEAGHFENVSIVFFCGGKTDSRFARVVHNGASDAQKDFGCSIEYVWSQ